MYGNCIKRQLRKRATTIMEKEIGRNIESFIDYAQENVETASTKFTKAIDQSKEAIKKAVKALESSSLRKKVRKELQANLKAAYNQLTAAKNDGSHAVDKLKEERVNVQRALTYYLQKIEEAAIASDSGNEGGESAGLLDEDMADSGSDPETVDLSRSPAKKKGSIFDNSANQEFVPFPIDMFSPVTDSATQSHFY